MKKMDEMEMSISLKAIKLSWLITAIALFAWGVFNFIKTHMISIALDILIMQVVIYLISTQICRWKMGDENGRKSFIRYIIESVFFILLFAVLLYFFH